MGRADSYTVPRVVYYSGSLSLPRFISPTRLSLSLTYLSRYFDYELWPRFIEVLQPRKNTSGLGSTAFARHYLRYRFLFLFLRLLRCFTSAGLAFLILFYSDKDDSVLPESGYPIRISPGLRSLAALRGFSQLVASFFACWHLGILRKPLVSSFPRGLSSTTPGPNDFAR